MPTKITELPQLTNPASTDVVAAVDVAADATKKLSIADLMKNAGSGTAAAPSIAFDGDSNTGFFNPSADQLGIATGGLQRLLIDGSGNVTLAGPVRVPAGTATAPAFAFSSDTNTGIYSPGADQLALSTGGSGRLFVDASGRIGIGAVATSRTLEVNTSLQVGATVKSASTVSSRLSLQDANTLGDTSVGIGSAGNDCTLFAGASEKLRITGDGLVGIGTSAPTASLHLQAPAASSGHDLLKLINGADAAELVIDTSANVVNFKPGLGDALAFWDPSSERVRITSAGLSGRLLVGTSADSGGALLQVNGNRIRVATAKTPASATDTGTAGEICWDASYVYVCTATNTWKRTALSTW